MNRQEATQYQVDAVTILEGANIAFDHPTRALCESCGGLVDLTSEISVVIQDADGTETTRRMTEANARALLATLELPPPPVICDWHDSEEFPCP